MAPRGQRRCCAKAPPFWCKTPKAASSAACRKRSSPPVPPRSCPSRPSPRGSPAGPGAEASTLSGDLDELWREFAAETQEHIEAIESLLAHHVEGAWSGEDIARLFRSFHSLKGAFLAVGFLNLEALAHRAEDILAPIREGAAPFDAASAALLLRVTDRMNELRDAAMARREDVVAASDILADLDRHLEGQAATGPAPSAEAVPLTDDPEMQGLYCELLTQRLPTLAGAFSTHRTQRESAAEAAEQLAIGAEMLSFERLALDLQRLAALIQEGGAAGAELMSLLDGIVEQAALIEEITRVPAGAAGLGAALTLELQTASSGLEALQAAFAEGRSAAILGACTALRRHFARERRPESEALLLRIEERLGRAGLGEGAEPEPAAILAALHQASQEERDLTADEV